jgi:hypothetical protein
MALTLLEAAKQNPGKVYENAVVELYAGSSDILTTLPFETISGNSLAYNRESSLPGIGFRGVNESYTPSTGVLNPLSERLVIAGGDLDVDKFILDTMGDVRATHEAMKIRALSLAWTKTFIKGDSSSDPREFDGLQTRLAGDQKIAAGSTANGTPLSLAKLDEAIDQTLMPTHLIMSKAMARKFTSATRNPSVSGYITWDKDEFGKRVLAYNGLPILTVDLDHTSAPILPFTEAATSGTATATSIYVVSFGDMMLQGLQNGEISVRDLGELQTAPIFRTRVEWYNGIAVFHGRAATRLWSISDAAIAA